MGREKERLIAMTPEEPDFKGPVKSTVVLSVIVSYCQGTSVGRSGGGKEVYISLMSTCEGTFFSQGIPVNCLTCNMLI